MQSAHNSVVNYNAPIEKNNYGRNLIGTGGFNDLFLKNKVVDLPNVNLQKYAQCRST